MVRYDYTRSKTYVFGYKALDAKYAPVTMQINNENEVLIERIDQNKIKIEFMPEV